MICGLYLKKERKRETIICDYHIVNKIEEYNGQTLQLTI